MYGVRMKNAKRTRAMLITALVLVTAACGRISYDGTPVVSPTDGREINVNPDNMDDVECFNIERSRDKGWSPKHRTLGTFCKVKK